MAIIPYNNTASIGLVTDMLPTSLPADDKNGFAWTGSQNMRFLNGHITKMAGYSQLIDTSTTVSPYYQVRITAPNSDSHYVYCGLNKIYDYFGSVHYNITRQTTGVDVNYAASADYQWHHCILNGFPVFNNGNDAPQSWNTISSGTKLTNLTGWPTNYKAKIMRSYKAYLIALGITDTTPAFLPNKIKWSAAALPGALPTSWDYTDLTNDAGEIELSDTDGYLVDCLPLNDYNIIYKNTSTYIMSYIGQPGNPFSIRKLFPSIGLLTKNCVCEFEGKHFVITPNDVVVHDGNSFQSVIDGKNKKKLFNDISSSAADRTFVVPYIKKNEIWICYASGSSTYPNNAMIYNYRNQTWTTRLMPETPHISEGFIDLLTQDSWDSITSTWDGTLTHWGELLFNKRTKFLSMVVPSQNLIHLMDNDFVSSDVVKISGTNTAISTYGYIERIHIFPSDQQNIKLVKRIWPKITKNSGNNNSIDIYVGTSMTNNSVVWQGPYPFNILTDNKVDLFATGRNISLRFSSNTDIEWSLNGFDLEVIQKGKW